MKKPIIIVDIDGTLANISHRRHYMESMKKDWDAFYGAMDKDTINEWCRDLIDNFKSTHTVILLSGRPSNYKVQTVKWLVDNKIDVDGIFMRKTGDFRKDSIVKAELLKEVIKGYGRNISFFVDDRQQVVDMWRQMGHVCLQCDEGNF